MNTSRESSSSSVSEVNVQEQHCSVIGDRGVRSPDSRAISRDILHIRARANLGVMYHTGDGVTQDYAEAVRWYRLAADQGYARAQSNLGLMYDSGIGVPEDDAEAVRWYRLAADQGLASAQVNLGSMYDNGRGVPQDAVEAARWYRLAADQGNADAQYFIGFMYDSGRGVPQDDVLAHMWFNLAASRSTGEDRERSVGLRDQIAEDLTPDALNEAQRLAREWDVAHPQQ